MIGRNDYGGTIRGRGASQAQITNIAGKADYGQLADNTMPNFGAPVWGNGRVNALRTAYERRRLPTAQQYRQDMAQPRRQRPRGAQQQKPGRYKPRFLKMNPFQVKRWRYRLPSPSSPTAPPPFSRSRSRVASVDGVDPFLVADDDVREPVHRHRDLPIASSFLVSRRDQPSDTIVVFALTCQAGGLCRARYGRMRSRQSPSLVGSLMPSQRQVPIIRSVTY